MKTFEVKLTTSIDDDEIAKKIVDDIGQMDFSDIIVPHYPHTEVDQLAEFDSNIVNEIQEAIDTAVVNELLKRIGKGEWIFT